MKLADDSPTAYHCRDLTLMEEVRKEGAGEPVVNEMKIGDEGQPQIVNWRFPVY